jgi:putative glutamine amidotransferase
MEELDTLYQKFPFTVFWGGADILPALYGERNTRSFCDSSQDAFDISGYVYAKENKLPCIGICRGSQFLWAMSGGKLCQHIDPPHMMWHDVRGLSFRVNSTHHQGAVPSTKPTGIEIIADHGGVVEAYTGTNPDGVRIFAVQFHPEMMGEMAPARIWFLEKVEKFLSGASVWPF